jgi:hypothetical protein
MTGFGLYGHHQVLELLRCETVVVIWSYFLCSAMYVPIPL